MINRTLKTHCVLTRCLKTTNLKKNLKYICINSFFSFLFIFVLIMIHVSMLPLEFGRGCLVNDEHRIGVCLCVFKLFDSWY